MLNGGGGLNADGLALDLQFAADKTLTARKGPTPTFTRGSTGTFVGSNGLIQSAAINTPRFDHTSAGDCRGLLIEESRTNVALYSGALSVGTGWAANLVPSTTSIVDGLGPDGNNAYEVAETVVLSTHVLFNTGGSGTTGATSLINGTNYTGSIFVKKVAGSVDWIQLTLALAGFGGTQYANFNISNGTTGNFAGLAAGTAPKIEAFSNGWYRCSITVAATSTTTTSSNLFLTFTNNADTATRLPSYTGSTSNKVLAAMCQFEVGSFPTSYIPTVASSVVRSADVCSITGGSFSNIFNPTEGSLYAEHYQYGANTNGSIFMAARSDDTGKIQISRTSSTQAYLAIKDNANNENFIYTPSLPVGVISKSALAYKANDSIGSVNSALSPLDTSVTLGTPTQFLIGYDTVGAGRRHNGAIAAIRYYKKRLPNAKIQALTV